MRIAVELPDLATWLASRRWFSAKDARITGAEVSDVTPVGDDGPWLVEVTTSLVDGDGRADTARWLLCLAPVPADARTRDGRPVPPVGTVEGTPVADVADVPEAANALASAIAGKASLRSTSGAAIECIPGPADPDPVDGRARTMGVEQSNTSVVIGDRQMVKVIRRLAGGPNPDVELTGALTEVGVRGVPALQGAVLGPGEEALVVVSAFVPGARGAWELAVEEAAGQADHGVAAGMADLGRLTAEIHGALAQLGTTRLDRSGLRRIATQLRDAGDRARRYAADAGSPLDPDHLEEVLAEALAGVAGTLREGVALQRIHGDLHLGQVIVDGDGSWWVLDFEGEPARPIPARRAPRHHAYDVAGMTRSFDYARATAVRAGGDPAHARAWAARARAAYLEGYGAGANPEWVTLCELEKVLYEIGYEAANRPEWLSIPLRALDEIGTTVPDKTNTRDDTTTKAPVTPSGSEPTAPAGRDDDEVMLDVQLLGQGRLHEPHRLLGRHPRGGGWVVRCWRPGARSVALIGVPGEPVEAEEISPGLFVAEVAEMPDPSRYRWRITYHDDNSYDVPDPYAYPPTLGDVDLHLLAEGRHEQAWSVMGANARVHEGQHGVAFAVWAPNAQSVRLVGDLNSWDGRLHPMRSLGSSGIWELFVPDVPDGAKYKYEIVTAEGQRVLRADPWAKWAEVPPGTASRVFTSDYEWTNGHPDGDALHQPMSTYEVHAGSWRWIDDQETGQRRPMTYRELAEELGEYVVDMGFTHVELLPVAEHPFGGSWGYQVTGQFAPTSRFGTPDDFRYFVDHMHGLGIGVVVDWVPAHFPRDEWALARFDGTALYEHADPRQGEHPDWGTMVFNYGRTEVRNFILNSALFWLESLRVDALRVDAVASMLYLDYSRKEGEWVPNEHGGRENLRAVELLQEVNATAYKRNPHIITIAEESTAWPGVSRPTHLGGLGFGFKWNMGWMHDTLSYFSKEPVYRRYHHNQLTFGFMYAWSEHFVLPLSHDEVVHGKGSLLHKMPGDRWQQFANLRSLYGWMWAHPGKKLLFMGGEFGADREWSEERELDWPSLADPDHAGLQSLIRDANRAYRSLPALWRRDDDPTAFTWIDANNADENMLSFIRDGQEGDPPVAVLANFAPVPRHGVRFGLPLAGTWREALNTDSAVYGGGNVGNMGRVEATATPMHGLPCSAEVTVPPLGVVWLVHEAGEEG